METVCKAISRNVVCMLLKYTQNSVDKLAFTAHTYHVNIYIFISFLVAEVIQEDRLILQPFSSFSSNTNAVSPVAHDIPALATASTDDNKKKCVITLIER